MILKMAPDLVQRPATNRATGPRRAVMHAQTITASPLIPHGTGG